jgi:hypothetical protein
MAPFSYNDVLKTLGLAAFSLPEYVRACAPCTPCPLFWFTDSYPPLHIRTSYNRSGLTPAMTVRAVQRGLFHAPKHIGS